MLNLRESCLKDKNSKIIDLILENGYLLENKFTNRNLLEHKNEVSFIYFIYISV